MTHKLIKTDNYLLVVDDSEIKMDDYYLDDTNSVRVAITEAESYWTHRKKYKKVIAHLPLNGSPILEGVPLLPPYSRHQEDGIEVICKQEAEKLHDKNRHEDWDIYNELVSDDAELIKIGYNKAREKYKYTEEDMRNAWNAAFTDALAIDEDTYEPLFFENFIKSLHQYPTEFETMDEYPVITDDDYFLKEEKSISKPKTITTTQGVQWVGKYK